METMKNFYSKWIAYQTGYEHSFFEENAPFSWPGFTAKFEGNRRDSPKVLDIRNNINATSLFENLNCPYCANELESNYRNHRGSIEWKRLDRVFCRNCGWWVFVFSKNKVYPFESFRNEFHEGVLHNFDYENSDEPITALRKRIVQQKTDLRSISPKQMEILVGSVLRDYYDVSVQYVGGPGDNGIDLLLTEGEKKIAVQVKRRESPNSSESVSTIRDFLGAIILGGIPKGIVVSTAKKFTKPAIITNANPNIARHGIAIDLYNHDKLMELIEKTKTPDRPWEEVPRVKFHLDTYGQV